MNNSVEKILAGGPPGPYCSWRLAEWTLATAIFSVGVELFFWPNLLSSSMFVYLRLLVLEPYIDLILLTTGFTRILFLAINGSWPVAGPIVRAIGAAIGSAVWLEMAGALIHWQISHPNGESVIGIPIYLSLTVCELVSSYRAASDVKARYGGLN